MKQARNIFYIMCLVATPFFFAKSARADDALVYIGAGGIEILPSENIVMEEQDLFLGREKIRTRFLFRNESAKDITAQVSFFMPDIAPEDLMKRDNVPLLDMLDFTVERDGRIIKPKNDIRAILNDNDITAQLKALKITPEDITQYLSSGFDSVQMDALKKIGAMHEFFDGLPGWNTRLRPHWEQEFIAGAQVEIYHTYNPFLGTANISPETIANVPAFTESFCMNDAQKTHAIELLRQPDVRAYDLEYTLSTGAHWKGTIRRLAVTIEKNDESDLIATCLQDLNPQGLMAYGVLYKDINPTEDIRVLFIGKE